MVVSSEYLSPLWGFILLGWYVIISSPLVLSVAVYLPSVCAAYYFPAVLLVSVCLAVLLP
jgi:hypothetical protein